MSTRKIKVGNVIVEVPSDSSVSQTQPLEAKKIIAERGDEAKPIESLPSIPNPNDFVGSALFQVHAVGRVGTSNKKWVNRTGVIIFGVIPIALAESALLWGWVKHGRWIPFVLITAAFGFILFRKGKPNKGKTNG